MKYKSSRNAMTLIEVVIALTIFAVGVLGALSGMSLSRRVAADTNRLAGAVRVAQMQIDGATGPDAGPLAYREDVIDGYRVVLRFEQRDLDLVYATVEVQWTEQGRDQSFRLTRIFAPREARSQ